MTQQQSPIGQARTASRWRPTTSSPATPPPSMEADRARRSPVWRWPLRGVASLVMVLIWTQPFLIGLFLAGDFSKLAAHALVGGLVVGLVLVQFAAAVLAWRPGGLPGWVVAVAGAMTVGAVVQIVAGYQRNLGVHIPLGVALATTAVLLAARAWWPTQHDRQRRELDRRQAAGAAPQEASGAGRGDQQ